MYRKLYVYINMLFLLIYFLSAVFFIFNDKSIRVHVLKAAHVPYFHMEVGKKYAINSSSLAGKYFAQWHGWYEPENWGVWSDSGPSTMYLKLKGLASSRYCIYLSSVFADKSLSAMKSIDIYADDKELRYNISQNSMIVYLPKLPASKVHPIFLYMKHINAISPESRGINKDPRLLGVGIESIEINSCPSNRHFISRP